MRNVIVFQNISGSVSVVYPTECGLTLDQIGKKDVPDGFPFWVVDIESIPVDRSFRDAWELDVASMGDPSGFGGKQ